MITLWEVMNTNVAFSVKNVTRWLGERQIWSIWNKFSQLYQSQCTDVHEILHKQCFGFHISPIKNGFFLQENSFTVGPIFLFSKKLKHVNVVDTAKQVILSAFVPIWSLCMNFHFDAVHVHCLEGATVLQLLGR